MLTVSLTVAVHWLKKPCIGAGFVNLNTDGHRWTQIHWPQKTQDAQSFLPLRRETGERVGVRWRVKLIALNFRPPGLFSSGRRRIQRRPGGRLQRLAVRQDFPVGKVGAKYSRTSMPNPCRCWDSPGSSDGRGFFKAGIARRGKEMHIRAPAGHRDDVLVFGGMPQHPF